MTIISAAATGYGMYQQNKAQKEARAEQNAAQEKAEKAALAKTPEKQMQDTSAQKLKKLNAYRAGLLNNIKTSGAGLGAGQNTVNQSAAAGLKTKIGE
jgi:hypothetical protein